MVRVTTDVAVIGAGPAGCVFATRMVQLGFDVCLLERARFPRRHLGESLSPGVMPMLASMGSAAVVEAARFPRVHEVSTNWDGSENLRRDPRAQGMLVDRAVFDALLLERARALGVRVLQPAEVRKHARHRNGWSFGVDSPDGRLDLEASFFVDASGRAGRAAGARRVMGPRTIALYAYWTGMHLPERPRIEAGEREWFWGVPIPDGSYNTLVFVDGARFRAEPRMLLEGRLRSLLERSALLRGARGPVLSGPVRASDATPYVSEDCVSERHIRIGDAALALDPLSSSGVQKAIQTALSGAIVVNTLLRKQEASEGALRFYRDSVNDAAARHRAWASSHYATAGARLRDQFWTVRAAAPPPMGLGSAPTAAPEAATVADDVPVRLSADCQWEEVPSLGAHFVEKRCALRHPSLDGPVAFLGGHELAPLLRDLRPGLSSRQLAREWSTSVPMATGLSIARWLSGHGVLEPSPAVAASR